MTSTTATTAAGPSPVEPQQQHHRQQQHPSEDGPADASSSSPNRKRARVKEAEAGAVGTTGTGDKMKVLRDTLLDPEAVAALRDKVRIGDVLHQIARSLSRSIHLLTCATLPIHPSFEQYPGAPGYPHCVVQDVLDLGFFRGLREEMVGALSANFKETDLFKLFQTGDLANLDAADPEMVCAIGVGWDEMGS